tara:strand:- start:429 stop:620 length:192 start_codon:yes stop_codon:yes gene_type:complete
MLTKEILESRLKEMRLNKEKLANKIDVTSMTMYNKFNNPDTLKISELKKLAKVGFIKSLIIEL